MKENAETTRQWLWPQSKLCYGADVSFVGRQLICHEEMRVCDKLPWQTVALGRGRGGWNGSRGCIRRRRIRFRVADVWRNLRGISSDTGWNKVGHIMCQSGNVFSLNVTHQTTCRPRNVCLQTQCCGSWGTGLFVYAAAVTTQFLSAISNVENWMKVHESKGVPVQSIKLFTQTHTE